MQSTEAHHKVHKSEGHAGQKAAAKGRTEHYSRVRVQPPRAPLFKKKTVMVDRTMEEKIRLQSPQGIITRPNAPRHRRRDGENASTKNVTLMLPSH